MPRKLDYSNNLCIMICLLHNATIIIIKDSRLTVSITIETRLLACCEYANLTGHYLVAATSSPSPYRDPRDP